MTATLPRKPPESWTPTETRDFLRHLAEEVATDPSRRRYANELIPLLASPLDCLRTFDLLVAAVDELAIFEADPPDFCAAIELPASAVPALRLGLRGNVAGLLDRLCGGQE